MIGFHSLLVLAAAFQVIMSQEFPQGPPPGPPQGFPNHKCAGPPPGVKNPQECCPVKPMYTEEELAECGFVKIDDENKHRHGPPDCSKHECLLKKKNLLNDDNTIKYAEAREEVNKWAMEHPDFKAPAETVKTVCMGDGGPPGPPQICDAGRLMFCTGAIIFTDCPTWQDTDDCKKLKDHMNECRGPNFPPK